MDKNGIIRKGFDSEKWSRENGNALYREKKNEKSGGEKHLLYIYDGYISAYALTLKRPPPPPSEDSSPRRKVIQLFPAL